MEKRGANFRYTLQRTMIIYFLLIGFAALLLGVEFTRETYNRDLAGPRIAADAGSRSTAESDALQAIEHLRHKAILMICIIMFVVVIVLMMFIKNITGPLQHMIEKSNEISRGDLSQTIEIEANNELADLGNVINEMSSNLQEIIHFSLNTCLSGRRLIDEANTLLSQDPPDGPELAELRQKLAELDNELATFKNIVNCFKFYSIEENPHG
jgi:HAMP domain-containing protein